MKEEGELNRSTPSQKELNRAARFIVWALRHAPHDVDLKMDSQGWVSANDLLKVTLVGKNRLTCKDLEKIVEEDSKHRLQWVGRIHGQGGLIRAAQGHSVEVDFSGQTAQPPETLFHGTASSSLDAIRKRGLNSARRRHVHLSAELSTAVKVGSRHGPAVVLPIAAGDLWRSGHVFYLADNGVWLSDEIPSTAIDWANLHWPSRKELT